REPERSAEPKRSAEPERSGEPDRSREPERPRAPVVPVAPTPVPPVAARPLRRVLSVSELNANIRELLEEAFLDVWVEGELPNVKVWNRGHLYFTLKDSAAQIKAVMFRSAVRYLRFKPQDGQHVIARAKVSAYEPKGEYQLVCEMLEPRGLGQLQMAFEQLKR